MKKLKLTKQGKQDLTRLNKFVDLFEGEGYLTNKVPDNLHPYDGLSKYDTLVFDMAMYCNGDYAKNKFKTIKQFAKDTVLNGEYENIKDYPKVIDKIKKAIKYEIVEIIDC